MKSRITALVFMLVFALALAVPALAGGWATITVEELPTGAVAGQPLTVRFTVRQHGRTLMEGLKPTVTASQAAGGQRLTSEALPVEGQPGVYEASLTFPAPGTWSWSIQAFSMDQRMPDLAVSSGAAVSNDVRPASNPLPLQIIALAGIALFLAIFTIAVRKQKKWAFALILLLLLAGGGYVSAYGFGKKPAQAVKGEQLISQADTGAALFVAKSCVTCHVNDNVDSKYYAFRSEFGPNLTHYNASPEFLRMWLKDPASVRPNTQMPDLGLKETEIEALIAFLSSSRSQSKAPEAFVPQAAEKVVTATPVQPAAREKSACSNLDRSQGLLVSSSRTADSAFSLIDPSTGQSLCGAQSIKMSSLGVMVYSPDRSALAVLSAESPALERWRLHWIDLRAWKAVDTGVVLDEMSQGLAIHPDGTRIAVAFGHWDRETGNKKPGYRLAQVDIRSPGSSGEVDLDILPRLVAYSGDGGSILVYGASLDGLNGMSTSAGKIRLYSSEDLSLQWETEIGGLLEGTLRTGDGTTDDLSQFTLWQPALVLSPDGEKLYIVHADADRLTTVDMAGHTTSTVEIQPRLSWLERLLRSTVRVAHAKVMNGTTKQAVLSADGTRLYVSGFTGNPHQDQQGNWQFEMLPLGLQVVATSTGNEIARLDTQTSEIEISSKGDFLLLRGWNGDLPWTDVLDAGSLKTTVHQIGQLLYARQTLSGESVVVGGSQGLGMRVLNIVEQKKFTPYVRVSGSGYWISAP